MTKNGRLMDRVKIYANIFLDRWLVLGLYEMQQFVTSVFTDHLANKGRLVGADEVDLLNSVVWGLITFLYGYKFGEDLQLTMRFFEAHSSMVESSFWDCLAASLIKAGSLALSFSQQAHSKWPPCLLHVPAQSLYKSETRVLETPPTAIFLKSQPPEVVKIKVSSGRS